MSQIIKQKVEKAIEASKQKKQENFQNFKCPLRCWDIFAMLKEEYKDQRNLKGQLR